MFNGVKVNIRGQQEGTPGYNAVLDRHRGAIQQFLNAQQQQVLLSGNTQYTTRASFDGAYATYSNNNGQEYLDIEVTVPPRKDEDNPNPTDVDEYWKWAIIELRVPGLTATNGQFSAFMNPPPKGTKGQIGVAWDQRTAFDYPPIIAYPVSDVSNFIEDLASNVQVSSLRVDMRPYPGGVKIDLYAYIRSYIDRYDPGPQQASPVVYAASRRSSYPAQSTFMDPPTNALSWYTPSDVTSHTLQAPYYQNMSQTNVMADWPELGTPTSGSIDSNYAPDQFGVTANGYGGGDITWGTGTMPSNINGAALFAAAGGAFTLTRTYNGFAYKEVGKGAVDYHYVGSPSVRVSNNGAGPSQADGNYGITFYDYVHYWVCYHPLVPHYNTDPRDAPVSFAVMDDMADSYTGQYYSGAFYSSQWETAKKYPKRWTFKEFPQKAHILTYADPADTSTANHFGHMKIGTITINPRKGKGGIKFVAA